MNALLPLSEVIVRGGYFWPSTLGLVIVIAIIGCVIYFVPGLDATLKKLLIGIAVVLFVVWLILMLVSVAGRVDV